MMYIITSKKNHKLVCLTQDDNGNILWDEQISHKIIWFNSKQKARHYWVTHRSFIPITSKKVKIQEMILEEVETLE